MNQPEPTCTNETQLFVTFIKLFIFIMSLFGVSLNLQSRCRSLAASKRPMEDDSSLDDVVKRAYYHDSEESNDGSSSDSASSGLRYPPMDISGIAPLEATTMITPVGSDARSIDDDMDEFLNSVALEQADSTLSVYYDAESERVRPISVLEDAIGENVFWSICHQLRNGHRTTCYKCHMCSSIVHADKLLLEHFVLEHEMDLIVV